MLFEQRSYSCLTSLFEDLTGLNFSIAETTKEEQGDNSEKPKGRSGRSAKVRHVKQVDVVVKEPPQDTKKRRRGQQKEEAVEVKVEEQQDAQVELDTSAGVRIRLSDVQEWCIEFSPDEATLWLTTDKAWYRLAGTKYRSLSPHPFYAPFFQSALDKFRICSIASTYLMGCLPSKPKTSYDEVVKAIKKESQGEMTEEKLVEHGEFVIKQISQLNEVDGVEVDFKGCKFIKNLETKVEKAKGEEDIEEKKEEKKALFEAAREAKKVLLKAWLQWAPKLEEGEARKVPKGIKGKRDSAPDEHALPEGEIAEAEGSYMEVEEEEEEEPEQEDTRPAGTSNVVQLPPGSFNAVLSIWAVLQMVGQETLNLSRFSIDWLQDCIMAGSHKGLCPTLYQECVHRMLVTIIKNRDNSAIHVRVVEEGREEEDATARGIENLLAVVNGAAGLDRTFTTFEKVKGGHDKAKEGLEKTIPQSWQEVVRLLIAERYDLLLKDYHDVLGECRRILNEIVLNKSARELVEPLNTAGLELDFIKILVKLDKGLYDGEAGGGHAKFLEDMRSVWPECEKLQSEDSAVVKVQRLQEEFEKAYKNRAVPALESKLKGDEDGWKSVINDLGTKEYHDISLETKVKILQFLSRELLQTDLVRSRLEKFQQAREGIKRMTRDRNQALQYRVSGKKNIFCMSRLLAIPIQIPTCIIGEARSRGKRSPFTDRRRRAPVD